MGEKDIQANKTASSIQSHQEHFEKLRTFLDEYDQRRGPPKPPTPEQRDEFEARFRHFIRSGKPLTE